MHNKIVSQIFNLINNNIIKTLAQYDILIYLCKRLYRPPENKKNINPYCSPNDTDS